VKECLKRKLKRGESGNCTAAAQPKKKSVWFLQKKAEVRLSRRPLLIFFLLFSRKYLNLYGALHNKNFFGKSQIRAFKSIQRKNAQRRFKLKFI